jgi:type VI secretion system protein ImpK
MACLAAAVLTGWYAALSFSLGHESDRLFQRMVALLPDRQAVIAHIEPVLSHFEPPAAAAMSGFLPPPPPSPPASPDAAITPSARTKRFQEALAAQVSAGQLEIITNARGDVIRIAEAAVFQRPGDTLSKPGHALIERLAQLLDREPGHLLVIGHTDDHFSPSVRFPSSLALSEAKARAVARVLVAHVTAPERIDIEGRGDTEPLAPNADAPSREHNRRVEIVLAPPPEAKPAPEAKR